MEKPALPLSPVEATLRTFSIHNRINLYLLDHLDPAAWLIPQPGGKGRTLAAMAAHIHSVRLMWLKAGNADPLPCPIQKDAGIPETRDALEASAATLLPFLRNGLECGRIPNFKPDAWAFTGYLISHESHHRGQMLQLARQLGFPVSKSVNFGLWEWGVR